MTEQEVMGLDTIHLCEHLLVYPYLDQSYLGKQGEHHRRRRYGCRAFVPWHLLAMGLEIQAHLPLNDTGDQQADDGEHRQGGIRSGFSSHTGAMAAGCLIHRNPGSTVVVWS